MQCLIKTLPPCDSYQQKAHIAHGRITIRATTIYQSNLNDFILDDDWASYIKTVVQVHRSTDVFDTKAKQYVNRQETAFYLSNHNLENAETSRIGPLGIGFDRILKFAWVAKNI